MSLKVQTKTDNPAIRARNYKLLEPLLLGEAPERASAVVQNNNFSKDPAEIAALQYGAAACTRVLNAESGTGYRWNKPHEATIRTWGSGVRSRIGGGSY